MRTPSAGSVRRFALARSSSTANLVAGHARAGVIDSYCRCITRQRYFHAEHLHCKASMSIVWISSILSLLTGIWHDTNGSRIGIVGKSHLQSMKHVPTLLSVWQNWNSRLMNHPVTIRRDTTEKHLPVLIQSKANKIRIFIRFGWKILGFWWIFRRLSQTKIGLFPARRWTYFHVQ